MEAQRKRIEEVRKALTESESIDVFAGWSNTGVEFLERCSSFSAEDLKKISANVSKIISDYERDMDKIKQEWEQERIAA